MLQTSLSQPGSLSVHICANSLMAHFLSISFVNINLFLDKMKGSRNQLWNNGTPLSQLVSEYGRGRYPVRHYWDLVDSRLLAIETAELTSDHPIFGVTSIDQTGPIADAYDVEGLRSRSQGSTLSEADSQGLTLSKDGEKSTNDSNSNSVSIQCFHSLQLTSIKFVIELRQDGNL